MIDSGKADSMASFTRFNLPLLGLEKEAGGVGHGSPRPGVYRSFMQSLFWARFKTSTGWKAYIFDFEDKADSLDSLVVLVRPLALGFSFVYVPHGPRLPGEGVNLGQFLEKLAQALIARIEDKILFLRFDLDWEMSASCSESDALPPGSRFRKGSPVQVPDTVLLDLQPGEENILAAMKPKWRYNIKLAEKRGVRVTRQGAEALPLFYKLYQETATRDGIAIHPLEYYEKLFSTASNIDQELAHPEVAVWVASHEGQVLAAIITLFYGSTATYLYGASSGEKRNLMPAYALQWAAIQAAKSSGCLSYDFFGIPPTGDPGHPMAGLYLFKTGFGGKIVHRLGSVDYPARPLLYGLFRTLERLRLVWFKKIRKTLRPH
jgi:lipid II:glycine glycyltransferase (peptidoglycan interpeptide bridge formation enzyme)